MDNGLGLQVFLVAYKEPALQELADVFEYFNSGMLWHRIPTSCSDGPPSHPGSKNASKESVRNVSKEIFQRWEQKVIKAFCNREDRSTDDDSREALGVLAFEKSLDTVDGMDVPGMVAAGMRAALPPKRKLKLWHAEKQAPDSVSYGCDGELFRYPVCEASGCGTALQPMGAVVPFEGERFAMVPGCDLLALSGDMCAWWRELAGRRLPGSLEADLVRWLQSLSQELDGHVALRFCRMPRERRVVVTADDVIKSTGAYYVCDRFGPRQVCEGSGLICVVSTTGVKPDCAPEVLDLECRPTSPGPPGSDHVRWRDICRAAVNDKTMLAKVTGDERYRLHGITRAVRDKVTKKRSSTNSEGSMDSADHNHMKIPLVLNPPATSLLESQRTPPQVHLLTPPASGAQPEAAAPSRKPPQLERARSGTSGSTSPPQSPSASQDEVPRSPSSKGTAPELIANHAPTTGLLHSRSATMSKTGLPDREPAPVPGHM
ncbi:unnamed protein product [Prorocentrum cordatum]|uniref:Uncharacterized protein n=1 Tax=Prorocentrum cordatum TaxID=2364126 RepID=A0ABN9XXV0_9DINO|nr:unnamed protein product [Polarella glacialis]